MPKLKTNKAAAKRFKLLKSGKVKRKQANLRHILTSKSHGSKLALRKGAYVDETNIKAVKQLMPYA